LNHEAKKFNLESISKKENSHLISSIGINQAVIDKSEKQEILNAINSLTPKDEKSAFNFDKIDDVNSVSINFNNDKYDEITQMLGLLSKHELIDFHNIEFYSGSSNLLFSQASSGQLCILLNVFGIASRIEDDSLILIDEPELSLHPKWQEEFLPLVKSVFDNFKRCHFVIATHSPQIASSLNDEDSYILKIGDGTLLSSTDIFKNSIDYQLVNIFEAPGFSNDYVSKELIKILTQISQKGEISTSLYERIKLVKSFKKLISSVDPLNKLYKLLDLAEGKYNDGV
jgi:predicted ATPase